MTKSHKGEQSHLDLITPIGSLPVRYQSLYAKRRESNLVMHSLGQQEAKDEARLFIARLIYRERCKRELQDSQLSLFHTPAAGGKSFRKERKL